MKRAVLIAYAIVAYAGFLGTNLWAMAFLANFELSHSIDHGHLVPPGLAVATDAGLLVLFAVHHSVMARPAAKAVLTRLVPQAAERSTYVLVADLLLTLVLLGWRPLPHAVWDLQGELLRALVWAVYLFGWLIAIGSTFMIDHFDLVGLKQAASPDYRAPSFQARWLYVVVRHPLMLGLLIVLWATPTMSVGHLLFSGVWSVYIALGIALEERGLRRELGEPYAEYASRTPAIIPGLGR